jgi:hypothetical protein
MTTVIILPLTNRIPGNHLTGCDNYLCTVTFQNII